MTGAVAAVNHARVAGHFGEWMQGKLGPDGPLALISVECPVLAASATATPGRFQVEGDADPEIAARFFHAIGDLPALRFNVVADAVLGGGTGMSTAGLFAMAALADRRDTAVSAALTIEGAVDPLAEPDFDRVLWASRQASVLETFDKPTAFHVVGGFWGPPEQTNPEDEGFPDIADLVPMWRDAAARSDRAALAGLSTEAVRRTTEMRGPTDDPTIDIAREIGALGVLRAHTGSARGLLFAPDADTGKATGLLAEAGLTNVLSFQTGASA